MCVCVCNLLNLINAAYIFGKADLSGLITIYDAYLWGRKSPPLSRSFSRDGTPLPPSMLACLPILSLFKQSHRCHFLDVISLSYLQDLILYQIYWSSGSWTLSTTSGAVFLLRCKGCVVNASVEAGHPTVDCSLHFD